MNQSGNTQKGRESGTLPSLSEGRQEVFRGQETLELGLRREVLASVARAAELATHLQSLAGVAFDLTGEVLGSASADDLARHANVLRALVTQGLSALAKLQAEAGRWEGVGAARRIGVASRDV
jgi:hypothetical protein